MPHPFASHAMREASFPLDPKSVPKAPLPRGLVVRARYLARTPELLEQALLHATYVGLGLILMLGLMAGPPKATKDKPVRTLVLTTSLLLVGLIALGPVLASLQPVLYALGKLSGGTLGLLLAAALLALAHRRGRIALRPWLDSKEPPNE